MDIDPVASVLATRSAATPSAIQVAVLKKNYEMEMQVATMLDQQAQSAPAPAPEGQGTMVDKFA